MMNSPRIDYHLLELKTARTPSSEYHIIPNVLPTEKRILDVGCGIGQTLISLNLDKNHTLVGIDIEHESLAYGHQHFDNIAYAQCNAELLPFAPSSFDLVQSRVALPYTNIPAALAEMHRVIKPGGRLWITLHSHKKTWQQLGSAIKQLKIKNIIFRFYVLANGSYFHLFGKMFGFPLKKGRYESFQTSRAISQALHRAGFTNLMVKRDFHFLVIAYKPKNSE